MIVNITIKFDRANKNNCIAIYSEHTQLYKNCFRNLDKNVSKVEVIYNFLKRAKSLETDYFFNITSKDGFIIRLLSGDWIVYDKFNADVIAKIKYIRRNNSYQFFKDGVPQRFLEMEKKVRKPITKENYLRRHVYRGSRILDNGIRFIPYDSKKFKY